MGATRTACLLITCLLLACGPAHAVTRMEVEAGAWAMYRARIAELAGAGMLDRDMVFLARVRRVAQPLIDQATLENVDSETLPWEFHISGDPGDNASCMAGGKILISQDYVERLGLSDVQLAMVISHEMQHAIHLHNLKEYEQALQLDPAWQRVPFSELEYAVDNDRRLMGKLAALNLQQEIDADKIGLSMAWRAGLPAIELATYFEKLEQASSMSGIGSATHPSPLRRWRTARAQAALLHAIGRTGKLDSSPAN